MDTFLHEPKSVSQANYRGRVDSNWPLCVCLWKRHCCLCRPCLCALRLRLMWWNPHGEMMCSAEGWQSREGLPMSEACWTTYTFRTAAPVRQRRIHINPPCSHYLSDFLFFFFFSPFLLSFVASSAAADVCPCALFMSHITYLISPRCLPEREKSEPLWVVRASGFQHGMVVESKKLGERNSWF